MTLRKSTKRFAVWLTLAALLFSALSPAMASVLFADRSGVLARVLGLPAQSLANFQADICHQDATGATSLQKTGLPPDGESDHVAHGVFCSFCLTASSVVVLPAAAHTVVLPLAVAPDFVPAGRVRPPLAYFPSTLHSRAPPVIPYGH